MLMTERWTGWRHVREGPAPHTPRSIFEEKKWVVRLFASVAGLGVVAFALVFFAARADWKNLNCRTWPEAGNCADALATKWVAVLVAVGCLVVAYWCGRRA